MKRPLKRPFKRHRLSTRVWHGVNALALVVLFMSGLNISNAHPRLYWGEAGFLPAEAWLAVPRFSGWVTIPGHYDLAAARDWHSLFAWVLAVGLTLFLLRALANGHLRRDIFTRLREWRLGEIREDIARHLRLDFAHGPGQYNFLQKVTYSLVLFVMLPLMIATGMALSPAMDAAWPFLSQMFGGRQSARSIHFVTAWALFGFFFVHVVLVALSNPARQVREMITGGARDEAA